MLVLMSENYRSAFEFLARLDAGELDDNIVAEVCRLTDQQRDELILLLIGRRSSGKLTHPFESIIQSGKQRSVR